MPISIAELNAALGSMKSRPSPGPDNIPTIMIEQLPVQMKQKIVSLFNKIWTTGFYPEKWREATVIPILKDGKDRTETRNYRPISLTCCLSKIMEKIINNRLIWWLETRNLICPDQSGFRKNHSTMDQIINLTDAVQENFEKNQHLVAVFFDLEKAFDMTWRFGILETLYKWGIKGNLPIFIASFLKDRYFRVRINDQHSSLHSLENGVPQGSTLSVTLFLCAINDMTRGLDNKIGRSLYVDDLAIYTSAQYMCDIRVRLQKAIDEITQYANNRGFRFSAAKTQCVDFCKLRQVEFKPRLKISNEGIKEVDSVKFLGVVFDKKLSWRNHTDELKTKCKRALNILKCMSNIEWGSNRTTLLNIYKSLVQSRIDYGSIVYGSASQTALNKLDALLYTGIRYATGAFCTSPRTSLCCETGILPLDLRRRQLVLNNAIHIWSQPNNINFTKLTTAIDYSKKLNSKHDAESKCFHARVKKILEEMEMHLYPTLIKGFCTTEPWNLSQVQNNKDLATHDKNTTHSEIFKSGFLAIKSEYTDAACIYTDGSKTNENVGCAYYVNNETYKWKLPPIASVYTAELMAISKALDYCGNKQKNDYIICTDSLSSIDSLENVFSDDPLVQEILAKRDALRKAGKKTIIVWTPGHIGINGNEKADKAAKEAATMTAGPEITKIRPDDLKAEARRVIWKMWQDKWNQGNAKLKNVKANVKKSETTYPTKRRESVIMTRLRIGHTRLTEEHLLTRCSAPVCSSCSEILKVEHIILHCKKWSRERKKLKMANTMAKVLSYKEESIKKIIEYCKLTQIYNEI